MKRKNKLIIFWMFFSIAVSFLLSRTVLAENNYNYYGYTTPAASGIPSTNNQDYWMTIDGSNPIHVYCINHNAAAPWADNYQASKEENLVYKKETANSALVASYVQNNNYGDDLEENLRKILYYLYTNPNTSTLTSNTLVWKVSGSTISLTQEEEDLYNSIIAGDATPSNFVVELFIPKNSSDQTLARGYIDPNIKVSREVTFSKVAVNSSNELPGASLKVVQGETADGNVAIDAKTQESLEWLSENTAKTFALSEGIYTMVETQAPAGYAVAEAITFRVTPNGKIEIKGQDGQWTEVFDKTVRMSDEKLPVSLAISKTVNGNAADKEKEFTFNITLTMSDNSPFSGQVTTEGNNRAGGNVTFSNGQATITLKDGENITFQGLDSSATYSVKEVDADDYQTLISIDGGNQQASKDYTGSLVSDTSIAFTNTKEVVPPTGVTLNVTPYLLLVSMTLLIGGCGYYITRKTRS